MKSPWGKWTFVFFPQERSQALLWGFSDLLRLFCWSRLSTFMLGFSASYERYNLAEEASTDPTIPPGPIPPSCPTIPWFQMLLLCPQSPHCCLTSGQLYDVLLPALSTALTGAGLAPLLLSLFMTLPLIYDTQHQCWSSVPC